MKKLYWVHNDDLYNFLWLKGIRPITETAAAAGYFKTSQLLAAIESYNIQKYYFPNKH